MVEVGRVAERQTIVMFKLPPLPPLLQRMGTLHMLGLAGANPPPPTKVKKIMILNGFLGFQKLFK